MELLRIRVKRGPSGLLIANSPDLAGLHIMERTEQELFASLRELIPVLFAEKGEKVSVATITPIGTEQAKDAAPWIVADIRATAGEHA